MHDNGPVRLTTAVAEPSLEVMSDHSASTMGADAAAGADVIDLTSARRKRDTNSPPARAMPAPPAPQVTFDRRELDQLLRVYGRKVAEGEWRDYAIDFGRERATFSFFRRASEMPQFRVVKEPRLARRQGAWSVVGANGQILKRGRELAAVLRLFDGKPRLIG